IDNALFPKLGNLAELVLVADFKQLVLHLLDTGTNIGLRPTMRSFDFFKRRYRIASLVGVHRELIDPTDDVVPVFNLVNRHRSHPWAVEYQQATRRAGSPLSATPAC